MLLKLKAALFVLLFSLFVPLAATSAPVHNFDCKTCHLADKAFVDLDGNICLSCHGTGVNLKAASGFLSGDASNQYGNNPAPGDETSHHWAATSTNPAAGASEPYSYPGFYSNYGTSVGKVSCSRCHQPHGDQTINPKLLTTTASGYRAFTAAPLTPDQMCLACHAEWNQTGNDGWLTHPLVADYNAAVFDEPDKYKANLENRYNAAIQLVDGGVSCTSCHGVHFVDSDSSTVDGPAAAGSLSQSDGKLLRGDGPNSSDKSSLCQTCHTYEQHGDNTGEKVGCLVCHSGHSYDPELPNYYVLRKTVNSATFGLKSGLDYSSADIVDPALADTKYTFWANPADASGYCEKCHGEITSLPQSVHAAGAYCTECHGHSQTNGGSFGHPGGDDCTACHASDHVVDNNQIDWVTIYGPSASHSSEIRAGDPGPIYVYATCTMCHTTNLLTEHNSNCIFCHFGNSPPRDSFTTWDQGCQQGSCHASYHPDASNQHDNYYWNAREGIGGANCNNCHGSSFGVPWPAYESGYLATAEGCGACHTLKPDTTPPVSESDILPTYIGDALISLSAFDPWGIQTIYYQIDSPTTQTYTTPITVTAPATGTQDHTLVFWARDKSGNSETPRPETFTIIADTTPPVTTSDARAYYGADATIHLTATDDATSMPVAATYYVFDDPNGTPNAGTTAIFPAIADGTEVHTLYFWSVDHAGNVEDQKSVDFTMVANGLEHTGISPTMASWVSGYSDPYFGLESELADPWTGYMIFIGQDINNRVAIGGPVMKHYDTYRHPYYGTIYPKMPQTWTSTWSCPPGIAVPAGSKIYLVINAGFGDRALWPDVSDVPKIYEITLPAGIVQLEPVDWTFSIELDWTAFDYFMDWDPYDGHSSIRVKPSVEDIAYVTTIADTTAPVTVTDAISGKVYGSAQTFNLTPSDETGGTGVESTWWQLDSTSGSWTKGTSVPIPAPTTVASTQSHTLYWYSQDHAGNQEPIKSVSFSIENLRTFVTTLPLDQVVWHEGIPDDGSGPWVAYTIKLDGTTLGSTFYATQYSYYNQKFNHVVNEKNITGAGQIDIIVTAGLSTPASGGNNTNSPHTFTLTLPPEASRLQYRSWSGFPNYHWTPHDYYYNAGPPIVEYPFSNLQLPTGTIGNIGYQSTGTASDTTPPVTTIDAVEGATYSGDQTFTLSATDPGSGVESTWWQFEGSGTWNIGTSVSITAPSSGTQSHTIVWYSRDTVANQEATQSVTFNLQP